ncbi:MAG: RagB/SusD family nutrient uptake outer membrane protein [Ferruginibacter sp.]
MKKYLVIITGILVMVTLASCEKALTEKLHSSISPENFYKTTGDAEAALNGAFSYLKSQTYYQRTIYVVTDLSADIFRPNSGNNDRQEIYRGTYTPFNGQLYSFWAESYITIKNCNDVITYVPGMNVDDAFKNNIVGNARFLRGMAFFDLVRMFGDIPIVLKNGGDQDLFPKRDPSSAVYEQAIADLQFAEQNCLHAHEIPSDKIGRASSEAASAMLARLYLQRASTSFGSPADNQSALTQCNKVIAYSTAHPTTIGLVANYQDIFDVEKKNGPESIFAVQFGNNSLENANITNLMFDPGSLGGYGSFVPNSSFYESYEAGDTRKAVNVGTESGGTIYVSKYRDPGVAPGGFGGTNWIVLRYSDILLMQSEAMHKLNPGDVKKFDGINIIRTRAGLGNKLLDLTNTPTPDAFVAALLNERLWELCLEGQRRWDLIRFGKLLQVKASQGFTVSAERLLYPIPQGDLDINKNLTQNPGY